MCARHKELVDIPVLLYIGIADDFITNLDHKGVKFPNPIGPQICIKIYWCPRLNLFRCVVL